jgi:hypothetical protein
MEVELADDMSNGWQVWLDWQRLVCPDNRAEISALEADAGRYLGYVRLVGRRRAEAKLDEPIVSMPFQYTQTPLLRNEESRT